MKGSIGKEMDESFFENRTGLLLHLIVTNPHSKPNGHKLQELGKYGGRSFGILAGRSKLESSKTCSHVITEVKHLELNQSSDG